MVIYFFFFLLFGVFVSITIVFLACAFSQPTALSDYCAESRGSVAARAFRYCWCAPAVDTRSRGEYRPILFCDITFRASLHSAGCPHAVGQGCRRICRGRTLLDQRRCQSTICACG